MLGSLMETYGSDKGSSNNNSWHNYTIFYESLFDSRRDTIKNVFELGLGTNNLNIPSNMGPNGRPGASLYAWRDYFPSANIYGADIDRDILFESYRIKTYYCDQTNPNEIKSLWNQEDLKNIKFDLIVEDGLHEYSANKIFFENSIHKLAPNGVYVIEDIQTSLFTPYYELLQSWRQLYPNLSFELVTIPSHLNTYDNTLVVIKNTNL